MQIFGYRPKDNAEQFAAEILRKEPVQDLNNPRHLFHGGAFAAITPGESGLAHRYYARGKRVE